AEAGQPGPPRGQAGARVQQGREEHVTRGAVARVDPEGPLRLFALASGGRAVRLAHRASRSRPPAIARAMRAAATPAPNPLSTFTVSTPGAQLFIVASQAVRPSRCQP